MAVPISFPSTTSHFNLPLLFSGQAQKEFFVNQALSIVDAVLQSGITASADTPPAQPAEGECYRVMATANGDWAGQEDAIAVRIGGSWHFVEPQAGMTIFDRGAGGILRYNSGWQSAVEPAAPSGGSTVDSEARAALSQLIQALRDLGTFTA